MEPWLIEKLEEERKKRERQEAERPRVELPVRTPDPQLPVGAEVIRIQLN